jgi:hypothetical protein
MKYVAAALMAAITFVVMVSLLTLIEGGAYGAIDWSVLHSARGIGWWNGGWSLVAAIAAFWLILEWRTKANATKRRKTLAARARA